MCPLLSFWDDRLLKHVTAVLTYSTRLQSLAVPQWQCLHRTPPHPALHRSCLTPQCPASPPVCPSHPLPRLTLITSSVHVGNSIVPSDGHRARRGAMRFVRGADAQAPLFYAALRMEPRTKGRCECNERCLLQMEAKWGRGGLPFPRKDAVRRRRVATGSVMFDSLLGTRVVEAQNLLPSWSPRTASERRAVIAPAHA